MWFVIRNGLLLVFLLFAAGKSFPQQTDDPSEKEKVEVLSFAKKFEREIRRTRDLTPYARNTVKYLDSTDFMLITPEILPESVYEQLSTADKEQWVAAIENLTYLGDLYAYSKGYAEKIMISDVPLDRQFTPDAYKIFTANLISRCMERDESGGPPCIRSKKQFWSYIRTLNRASASMRKQFSAHPPEATTAYKRYANDKSLDRYNVRGSRCSGDECGKLLQKTEVYYLNIPVLSLQIARIKGKLVVIQAGIIRD